jgi:hypothetical protein
MHRSVADRRLHRATPVDAVTDQVVTNQGPKSVPILGKCSRSSPIQEFAALARSSVTGSGRKPQLRPAPWPNSARYQASAVGVGSGSDCGGTVRERARLCLRRVGCDAASTTSGSDPERVAAPEVG